MVANVDNMRATFIKCNNEYFEGKLPELSYELVHSYNTCAYFHYSYDRWFGSKFYDPIIQFTDYYDFTEKQFVDIMCHEMIHYYLAYFGIDRKCKHGKKFKEMATQLNRAYGLHITPYLDLSKYKRNTGRTTSSNSYTKSNQMRFFKEVWGFIFEFNSIGDYLSFLLGRVLGVIIFIGILLLLYYFL